MKLVLRKDLGPIKERTLQEATTQIEGRVSEALSFFDLSPTELIFTLFEAQAALMDDDPNPDEYPSLSRFRAGRQTIRDVAGEILELKTNAMREVVRLRELQVQVTNKVEQAQTTDDVKSGLAEVELNHLI